MIEFYSNDDVEFRIVLTHDVHDLRPRVTREFGGVVHRFSYDSQLDGMQHVYRRLRHVANVENADCVITNDSLGTAAMAACSLKSTRIVVLHGDAEYYYRNGASVSQTFDSIICVSDTVQAGLMSRLRHTGLHCPVVKILPPFRQRNRQVELPPHAPSALRLIFCGRQTEGKGFDDLPKIDRLLQNQQVLVEWTIILPVVLEETEWLQSGHVTVHESIDNEAVLELMCQSDVLCFPTRSEGFGLVVAEAIASGAVPVVSDLPIMREITSNGRVGVLAPIGDFEAWASAIETLARSDRERHRLRDSCLAHAKTHWCPTNAAALFVDKCLNAKRQPNRSSQPLYGSRLDSQWIPNSVTRLVRKLKLSLNRMMRQRNGFKNE